MEPTFAAFREQLLSQPRRSLENIVLFRCVDSTNQTARRVISEFLRDSGESPELLLVAFEQAQGRGREGRSWESRAGLGVYASLLTTVREPGSLPTLPLLVGVGLCRGLAPHLSREPRLKWPNDVLVEGRKLGGILIEIMGHGGAPATAIVGLGVNHGHRQQELPTPRATSVRIEGRGELPGLGLLTMTLVQGVRQELGRVGDAGYAIEEYRQYSAHRPGDRLRCRVGGRAVAGEFLGFDESGQLRLATASGEERLSSGEIIELP